MYSTSAGTTGGGTVLLVSASVAGTGTGTGGGSSSSLYTVSTIGSGGTGGGTGGMISGGTIGGLEQIELIVRPSENPEEHHPGWV